MSLLFGVVNAVIGTLLRLLTLPLTVLTLGLFSFVINRRAARDHRRSLITCDRRFWTAIWAAVIMAIVSMVLHVILAGVSRSRAATPANMFAPGARASAGRLGGTHAGGGARRSAGSASAAAC